MGGKGRQRGYAAIGGPARERGIDRRPAGTAGRGAVVDAGGERRRGAEGGGDELARRLRPDGAARGYDGDAGAAGGAGDAAPGRLSRPAGAAGQGDRKSVV